MNQTFHSDRLGRLVDSEARQAESKQSESNLGYSTFDVQEALRACMALHPPTPPDYTQHPDASALAHLFATMLSQNANFVPMSALSDKLRTLLAANVHDGKPESAPAKCEWNRRHG